MTLFFSNHILKIVIVFIVISKTTVMSECWLTLTTRDGEASREGGFAVFRCFFHCVFPTFIISKSLSMGHQNPLSDHRCFWNLLSMKNDSTMQKFKTEQHGNKFNKAKQQQSRIIYQKIKLYIYYLPNPR